MKANILRPGLLVIVSMLIILTPFGITPVLADDQTRAQAIIDRAKSTFDIFMADKDYTWLHENLKSAKGLLIYPQVLKGGFIFGGTGGTGVLLVKEQKTGDWSQPAFYTLGSVTFGLQLGGEASEIVVMVMTQKGIDSLYTSSVKLGGDTSVALGPVGAGAKGNILADFISFSKSKGLYAGVNLEGAVLKVRESLNSAYYGSEVSPVQIIVENKVLNKGADEIRMTLKQAVK